MTGIKQNDGERTIQTGLRMKRQIAVTDRDQDECGQLIAYLQTTQNY